MQESEIKKAAATLLEKIFKTNRPANELINTYLRMHRYVGSNDRKTLYHYLWTAIRSYARLTYLYPDASWDERLEQLGTLPAHLDGAPDWVNWEVPDWLLSHIPGADQELPALLEPAPVILRAIADREKVRQALADEGIPTTPTPLSPFGLKVMDGRYNITASKTYKAGLVEVQDEGAQMIALEAGVKPKSSVFDFCAGAGGKSLIFAQLMNNQGEIASYDVSVRSLKELEKRAYRAHISIIRTHYKLFPTYKKFDYVVVDAPCSGTGTWRRCPDARWNLTEKQLMNITHRQAEILETACAYVKDDHFLVYMTCSLTQDENEDQIQHFLEKHPEFHLLKQKRFSPYRTGTDGFFVAVLQR